MPIAGLGENPPPSAICPHGEGRRRGSVLYLYTDLSRLNNCHKNTARVMLAVIYLFFLVSSCTPLFGRLTEFSPNGW